MDAFKGLEELVRSGKLIKEATVLGHKVGYRTLSYMQEAEAFVNCVDNQLKIKVEVLSLAITSFDSVEISDSDEDRTKLKSLLSSLSTPHVLALFTEFEKLVSNIPKLTQENIETPLVQDQQLEAFMTSASSVESFQTTP